MMPNALGVKRKMTSVEFRRKWIPICHLLFRSAASMATTHYIRFHLKVPCFDSEHTGYIWMRSILESDTDVRCVSAFRMEKHVLLNLCDELEKNHGLRPSKNMSVLEKVGIFLYTIALGISNRDVCERFQRSGDTISRVMHQVLDAMVGRKSGYNGLVRKLLRPRDTGFSKIPTKILSCPRYKLFKGAIGCIDGVHISACISEVDQFPYRNRKGWTSFNIMGVCDFDMYFIYVSVGWEGSALDTRVLEHSLSYPHMKFPLPPIGRYYLCDKGYPDRPGYLVPYSKVKYHQSQFKRAAPKNIREGFNRIHFSLRTTVERCFGVLKKRWKILNSMPLYPVQTQVDITCSCFALHNYILEHKHEDALLDEQDLDHDSKWVREDEGGEDNDPKSAMGKVRDAITAKFWSDKKKYLSGM